MIVEIWSLPAVDQESTIKVVTCISTWKASGDCTPLPLPAQITPASVSLGHDPGLCVHLFFSKRYRSHWIWGHLNSVSPLLDRSISAKTTYK